MRRIYICVVLLIFSSFHVISQADQLFTVEALKEDFRILRLCLESNHAGLYTYTAKEDFDKIFEEMAMSINRPATSIDFYRTISPLLKHIGDGHTEIPVPKDFMVAINNGLPRFPFALQVIEDKLYVLRNLSNNESIHPGLSITHINGKTSAEIIQLFTDNVTRDGYNVSAPHKKIGLDFTGRYAIHIGTPEKFEIKWIDEDAKTQGATIEALSISQIKVNSQQRYQREIKLNSSKKTQAQQSTRPLSFEIIDSIAYLTVRSFVLPLIKKHKLNYKEFFRTTFEQISAAKINHLILDVRDNGGGYPEVVNELYSYLGKEPFVANTTAHTITNKIEHRKYYEFGFFEFLDMKKSLKLKKEGDIYKVVNYQNDTGINPVHNSFKGELYVLINPFCFSATTSLLGMLRNSNRGIFIGDTAGGCPHKCTAWIMPLVKLPNTKIKCTTPLVKFEMNLSYEDNGNGVQPDIYVKETIHDIIDKRDTVMEYTINKIRNVK